MPLRTFIALDLDEHILDGLVRAQQQLADPADKVKWVERANLHVTLKFLGDVAEDRINDVCTLVRRAAAEVNAFDYDVRGLSVTPSHGPLRMVWGDIDDPSGLMAVLHDQLDSALAGLGFKEENRQFRPHITVARIKHVQNAAAFRAAVRAFADAQFGVAHGDEVVAYTSTLTDEGPVYAPLCRAPIGA
jgi:RNA 2',3'-cyclic 3'-phosphodiesterase